MFSPGTPERGQEGAGAPPAFQLGSRGSKSALFKCNDLLLIVNIIQRSKQYLIGKDNHLYDCERHPHDIPQKCPGFPPFLGYICWPKVVGALLLLSAPLALLSFRHSEYQHSIAYISIIIRQIELKFGNGSHFKVIFRVQSPYQKCSKNRVFMTSY